MTSIGPLEQSLIAALDLLKKTAPKNLAGTLEFVAGMHDLSLSDAPLDQVTAHIASAGVNDGLLHYFAQAVQTWDHAQEGTWLGNSAPHSQDRRDLILSGLGFDHNQQQIINTKVLRYSASQLPTVIAEDHEPWYAERKKQIIEFYWPQYAAQLQPPRGNWTKDGVGILDLSIDDVVSRLSDPTRPEIYPVKGLVMGYVQSGKTSHFSGLIAKAADAGYKLVIVLAGTMDLLREQTQRRIDKELVGKELLGNEEYSSDPDWNDFASYGDLPSRLGAFDWDRLTNREDDYESLSRHLSLLEFRSSDRTKPFNHPDNLRTAPAKIAILKKHPARIDKLCDDLEASKELRNRLEHVPTLIIDDESDQASVNTLDQNKPEKRGQRTGTNREIVRLLKLLPRAQYVGYTATPFANVFIDPEDAEDLFPKDFIVSLPRPKGYMGVADFFDFDETFAEGDYKGNKNAFVRSVEGANELEANLPRAIDAFVLSGALKLFRSAAGPDYRFRHHTMLVHHSQTQVVHERDSETVSQIFGNGARYQSEAGLSKLRELFESDFAPVSAIRSEGAPIPPNFDALRPYIADCLTRICADKAVRVVNGDGKNRDDTPDFDASPVWAILVGGTKLSRGYTVEGLTVSYYRRPAGAADTLMQMGRWFGFRNGYKDLVRLFLGSKEKKGKVLIDLYEAFGAVCKDEEALRVDLRKYADLGLKPRQVPPLVRQHWPKLPPTARNKMFNAVIHSQDFGADWTEKTQAPTLKTLSVNNLESLRSLLEGSKLGQAEGASFKSAAGIDRSFTARFGLASADDILAFLTGYSWADGRNPLALELGYIQRRLESGALKSWLVMAPQASKGTFDLNQKDLRAFSKIERSRVSSSRFGVYSEPRHREAAAALAGVSSVAAASTSLTARVDSTRPVLVVYLVEDRSAKSAPLSVGFGIQYPGPKVPMPLVWTVNDNQNASSVVVPIKSGGKTRTKR